MKPVDPGPGEGCSPARLLLVDDTPANLNVLCELLATEQYDLCIAMHGAEALDLAHELAPDLILLDVMMPGLDGYEVCRRLKTDPATAAIPVIFVTAHAQTEGVVAGFTAGAVDYVTKPFREHEVLARVRTHLEMSRLSRELDQRNRSLTERNSQLQEALAQQRLLSGKLSLVSSREEAHWGLEGFVGRSATLRRIFDDVRLLQESAGTSVLITGESGTGKELLARALHFGSPRRAGPFVPVNCAALPGPLVESLFFGHVRGAFTGADADRVGYFEMAHGGTLFLDEVGEMPTDLQAKLLRVLEDGVVRRVGERDGHRFDVRVVAATNQDLEHRLHAGGFRQDLYFRLARFTVVAPPLRQRQDDIPLLADHFVRLFAGEMGRGVPEVDDTALAALTAYAFPGNVRELKNIIERAVLESRGGRIMPHHLHLPHVTPPPATAGWGADSASLPDDLDEAVAQVERSMLRRALERTNGNVAEAARLLNTNRNRVYRILAADRVPGDSLSAAVPRL